MGKGTSGDLRLTADGVVGVSGKPVRIWNATWLSDGTARDLVLRSGTGATGAIIVQAAGIISQTVTLNFENGKRFPNGCFLDIGSATSVNFELETEF